MSLQGVPVLRLTLEGMQFDILKALTQYQLDLAEETRKAVEKFCTPENVQATSMRRAIEEEVERFYRTGAGREVIRQAVNDRLGRPV